MFYPFPPLLEGVLLRRYKRFMADIELVTGEVITAHCPNTGPMTGICLPGHRVWVSKSDNPKRKYAHTWELVEVLDNYPTWVGVNTNLPNRVVKLALEQHCWPELGPYDRLETEVNYGEEGSRVDFRLGFPGDDQPDLYLEVKNTTWCRGTQALFPDTVTTRGQKHLRELTALLPQQRAVMLYFVNRGDCDGFRPGDEADPTYGQLLRQGVAAGLVVLPCSFHISPQGIEYKGLLPFGLWD